MADPSSGAVQLPISSSKIRLSPVNDSVISLRFFICEEKYVFEIGGKNKDFNQIKNIENSFLALDDIEYGYNKKIPLWVFGFLY